MSDPTAPRTDTLTVRTITAKEHRAFLASRRSASFLQTPAWGEVKSDWRRESIGWHRDGKLVGAGLVLYRQLPRVKRYLAYLPEGPVIDWDAEHLSDWLAPMTRHLGGQGAFGIRMGPPVICRHWDAAAIKAGIADDSVSRLDDLVPTLREARGALVTRQLERLGWRQQVTGSGFAAGQPRFNFQIPLREADGTARTDDDVLRGMNQQWRRNIKKAAKEGVETRRVATDRVEQELKRFHDLYVHTAERDRFTPRPLSYFRTMFRVLGQEDPHRIALFTAEHEGDLVAATVLIQVGGHVWYSYGASSTDKREVRGSNAVQWEMIRHALRQDADVYDLRGITDTLDAEDSHVGLIQFKVGTGGEAVEYVGEWDLPVSPLIYKAFSLYLARRG